MILKKKNVIYAILLFGFCSCLIIFGIWQKRRLEENHRIGLAYAYNSSTGGLGNAGRLYVDFTINVQGKTFKGSSVYQTSEILVGPFRGNIIGKSFPAVYNPKYPSISAILITPKDFSRYGYSFPDSLQWVLRYLK